MDIHQSQREYLDHLARLLKKGDCGKTAIKKLAQAEKVIARKKSKHHKTEYGTLLSKFGNKRSFILNRDNYKCVYCDTPLTYDTMTIDHFVPQHTKSVVVNTISNQKCCCYACNTAKEKLEFPSLAAAREAMPGLIYQYQTRLVANELKLKGYAAYQAKKGAFTPTDVGSRPGSSRP